MTVYNSLSIKNYIKEVNKQYLKIWNTADESTCSDKLWLLSCGEIWDNGTFDDDKSRGYSRSTEGNQYKYYKTNLGSTAYNSSTNVTKKYNTSRAGYWWLRSIPFDTNYSRFCAVTDGGDCNSYNADFSFLITPGFSI